MNPKNTEMLALNRLKDCIAYEKILESQIPENDKEPSWDGEILIYKNELHNAINDGVSRVPVQVKGKCCDELIGKETISFQVRYGDLRNYSNERGVVYFVIIVSENNKDLYSIYYNVLTPYKLNNLLCNKEEKSGQQTVALEMIKLNDKKFGELTKILRQYDDNWKKEIQILDNNNNAGKIKDIFCNTSFSNNEIFEQFNQGNLYFYSKLENGNYGMILDKNNAKLREIIKVNDKVLLEDKVFYDYYEMYKENEEDISIMFGKNITLKINSKKIQQNKNIDVIYEVEFNDIQTLKNDILFLKQLTIKKCLLKFSNNAFEIYISNDNIKNLISYIEKIFYILDSLDIKLFKKQISQDDKNTLNFLIDILDGKRNDVFHSNNAMYHFRLEKRDFMTFIIRNEKDGRISFYNIFKNINYWAFMSDDNGVYYKVPMFSQMKAEMIKDLDDESFEFIVEKIRNSDINKVTLNLINNLLLQIISVYDITNRDIALTTAEKISIILNENFDNDITLLINSYQIKKRLKKLTLKDKKMLFDMKNNENDLMILCCINIIIENYYDAEQNFESMSNKEKKIFKTFPICNLTDKNLFKI